MIASSLATVPQSTGWRSRLLRPIGGPRIALAVILLLGAGLRFWGLRFGLPHDLARPDEEKIIGAALGVLQGDPNPHMFLYPSLFIYANAAIYWLLFVWELLTGMTASRADFVAAVTADPTPLHVIGRTLSALCGAATIGVLYAGARELFQPRIALAAAALLSVAFLHVRDSHFGVTDVPVTLLVVSAWWSAICCATRGATRRRVVVTGILCGLAASTKYNAALVGLPAAIAIADQAIRAGKHAWPEALANLIILLTCAGLAFFAGTPYALLDRPAFLADVDAQRQTAAGLRRGSILDPARAVVGERGWTHHVTFSLRYGLGIPLLVTALAGAFWLAIDRSTAALLILSFPLAFYAAMGSSLLVYPRWVVPMVPFLCLTAAVMVDRTVRELRRRSAVPIGRGVAVAVVTILIASPTAARSVAFDRLVARSDTRVRAARWIEDRFPGGASLYQTGMFYGFVEPRPKNRYATYTFNERHDVFESDDRVVGTLPDLIVVLESPLIVFSRVPERLDPILRDNYVAAAIFKAGQTDGPPRIYDQQDAFYVPFANLTSVVRPGPEVRIFERRR